LILIGVLSSLKKEIKFYRSKTGSDNSTLKNSGSELQQDINIILKTDFDIVIFINENNI